VRRGCLNCPRYPYMCYRNTRFAGRQLLGSESNVLRCLLPRRPSAGAVEGALLRTLVNGKFGEYWGTAAVMLNEWDAQMVFCTLRVHTGPCLIGGGLIERVPTNRWRRSENLQPPSGVVAALTRFLHVVACDLCLQRPRRMISVFGTKTECLCELP
jgi:hypothetical protein